MYSFPPVRYKGKWIVNILLWVFPVNRVECEEPVLAQRLAHDFIVKGSSDSEPAISPRAGLWSIFLFF